MPEETSNELSGEVEVVAEDVSNGEKEANIEQGCHQEEDEEEILCLGDSNPEGARRLSLSTEVAVVNLVVNLPPEQ